jgi:hypothetical protein
VRGAPLGLASRGRYPGRSMRKLLYAAVSAVLLPTATFAAEPAAAPKAKTEAPAAKPAEAKPAEAKPTEGPAIPAGWSLVSSPEGKFRAAFPTQPQVERTVDDTDAGKAQTVTYSVTSEKDESFLAVAVTQFPDGTVSKALPTTVLEGARDGSLANINGKLVADKAVMVDAPKGSSKRFFPARDYEATGAQDLRVSTRVILVEDRLYQIMFVRGFEKNEQFKQLLSTFALEQ